MKLRVNNSSLAPKTRLAKAFIPYSHTLASRFTTNGSMKKSLCTIPIILLINACTTSKTTSISTNNAPITIAFGSCNDQKKENFLWKEIVKHQPDVWIWGGDNTYSDTDNMDTLRRDYQVVLQNEAYKTLQKNTKIVGTWDDHDYGLNDGGSEFHAKKQSQAAFLDFMGVSKTDKRRQQEGVYSAETIKTKQGSVRLILLDTRYFRSNLMKNPKVKKRFVPNAYGEGTMLGDAQWAWLEKELNTSTADFNVVMSSVQLLSGEHGFETWGNMPHEVDKFTNLVKSSKAKGVVVLSGDRHISEFSKKEIEGVNYPLIDFTSSGLTHAYTAFTSEINKFRVGEVVPKIAYGLLLIDLKTKEITMQIRGKEDALLGEFKQMY
jgi:alkaline phosphatase D